MTKLLSHVFTATILLSSIVHAQISTVSRYKTWGREVLTSADLNALQDHLNAKINELVNLENTTPSAFTADTLTALQYGQVGGNQIVTANQLSAYSGTAHTHSAATLDNKTGTGTNIVTDVSPNMTGTPTISSNAIVHLGNDGAGSGVDADLLDGQQAAAFAGVSHNHATTDFSSTTGTGAAVLQVSPNLTGTPTISGSAIYHAGNDGTGSTLDADLLDGHHSTAFAADVHSHASNGTNFSDGVTGSGAVALQVSPNFTGTPTLANNKLWSEGNDGAGSGLDADLFDGNNSSDFAGVSHNHASGDFSAGTTGSGAVVLRNAPEFEGIPKVISSGVAYAIWHANNDGTNSTLDADLLDGEEASAFADASHSHATGAHTHATADLTAKTGSGSNVVTDTSPTISSPNLTGSPTISGYTIWHSGNDGTTSTLDADLFDGNDSGYFSPSTHNHTGTYSASAHNHTGGSGSLLDADLLDGNHSSDFAGVSHNHTAGSGSGLDADLLDGNHSSDFAGVSHNHSGTYSEPGHNHTLAGASDISTFTTGTGDIVREDEPTLEDVNINYTLDMVDVNGTTSAPNTEIRWYDQSTDAYPWTLRRETATMRFSTVTGSPYDKLTIDTDGVTVMGNDNNGYALYVGGTAYATGTWSTSSDERYKQILGTIDGATAKLRQVDAVRYQHGEGWPHADSTTVYLGVSAQQLQAVYPELVTEAPDGRLGVQYANLSAVLLQAVRELDARVAALEAAE